MYSILPEPLYTTRPGMSWDTDGEVIHVKDGDQLVLTISVSELMDFKRQQKLKG